MLKEVIAALSPEDARYHMKRCVDSGLWVADANANEHGLVEERVSAAPEYVAPPAYDDLDLD